VYLSSVGSRDVVDESPVNGENLRTAANLIAEFSSDSTSPTATVQIHQSLFRFIPISDLVDSDSDEDN
jgi:hypothetical protein